MFTQNSLKIHSNSLFSKIHSLKSEHIHSFLFREYYAAWGGALNAVYELRNAMKKMIKRKKMIKSRLHPVVHCDSLLTL